MSSRRSCAIDPSGSGSFFFCSRDALDPTLLCAEGVKSGHVKFTFRSLSQVRPSWWTIFCVISRKNSHLDCFSDRYRMEEAVGR